MIYIYICIKINCTMDEDKLFTILLILIVLAFFCSLVAISIYARKKRKEVEALRIPPRNIEQIKKKSNGIAILILTIACILAYLFANGE